ncbi:MAG TPA: hypothetical protein VMU89_06665 [Thermomicrobiaceae bacterium]|nr:hypothetical protein [Thermomicrobiaceae bacterium]
MVTETRIIAAAYPEASDAQSAVMALRQHGFSEHDISVLYTDAGHTIRAGLLDGAVWGGVLGALFGLFFPPAGLLVAAGPIAGALASGATLGAAGALTVGALEGLVTGLVHLGLPKEVATGFGEQVHKGDTLVIAHASDENAAIRAQQVLEAHHPRAETAPSGVVTATPPAN